MAGLSVYNPLQLANTKAPAPTPTKAATAPASDPFAGALYFNGSNNSVYGEGSSTPVWQYNGGTGGDVLGASTTRDPYNAQAAADAQAAANNNAYIDTQIGDLNSLLGRADTGLNQGLDSLNSSYNNNVGTQNAQKAQALQNYSDQRVTTNKDKLSAYDKINQNANAGYRSLAQIIGRGAGTGSSAFQELLPNAIGKELSGQRTDTNQTYATNLGNIDTAQKKTEQSFAQILQDLANQRSAQEQQLRTGVEQQKQGILGQQQQLQAARGNMGAAQALQPQIENSRNSVEGFFNQFKPTYSAAPAAIAAPDLSQYNVDRSVVNAQQQGSPDPTNPYADLLRKRLQESSGGF